MRSAFGIKSGILSLLMAALIMAGISCGKCPFGPLPPPHPSECSQIHTDLFFSDSSKDDDFTYYQGTVGASPTTGWEFPGYSNSGWDELGVFCIGIPQEGVASLPQSPLASALPVSRGAGFTGCPHSDLTHADWLAPAMPDVTCTPGYPTYHSGDIWYLRRDLKIDCKLKSVRVQVAVDNAVAVYFDGVLLGEDGGYYSADVDTYTATSFLPGKDHTVAFRVTNHDDCSQTGLSYVVEAVSGGKGN